MSKQIDAYSFALGVCEAFCEVVRAGVKRIALSHPFTEDELQNALGADFLPACEAGVLYSVDKEQPKGCSFSYLNFIFLTETGNVAGFLYFPGFGSFRRLIMRQIKKIAITNEKGGVGKTMTAVNLSACLAQRGYRVLLIDADPQGYATLNYDVAVSPSLLEVLRGQATCTETVQTTRFGVDVLPSDRTLSIIEEDLIRQKMNGAPYLNTLEKALEDLPDYDFVIIDCPPQGGRLMDIVHYYADAIIMPMFAEDYGIHALTLKAEAIADIRRTINPNLKILGGLITMDERRGLRSVFREVLLGQDLLPMFNTTIRRNVALIRAVNAREPICVFDKRSNGNIDYQALADEFLRKVGA